MEPIILNDLMYERGRGPELRSQRITVYDLVPYLLQNDFRDELMFEAWPSITSEELQALKAYIAEHRDEVMKKHWEIESRHIQAHAAQCTPENLARWNESHQRLMAFKKWIEDRKREGNLPPAGERYEAYNVEWTGKQHELVGSAT